MYKIICFLLTVANMGRKQGDFFITTKIVWKKKASTELFLLRSSLLSELLKLQIFPPHPFTVAIVTAALKATFSTFWKSESSSYWTNCPSSQDPLFSIKVQANQFLLFSEYNTQNQKIKCFNLLSTDHVKDILENTSEGCRNQKDFSRNIIRQKILTFSLYLAFDFSYPLMEKYSGHGLAAP